MPPLRGLITLEVGPKTHSCLPQLCQSLVSGTYPVDPTAAPWQGLPHQHRPVQNKISWNAAENGNSISGYVPKKWKSCGTSHVVAGKVGEVVTDMLPCTAHNTLYVPAQTNNNKTIAKAIRICKRVSFHKARDAASGGRHLPILSRIEINRLLKRLACRWAGKGTSPFRTPRASARSGKRHPAAFTVGVC